MQIVSADDDDDDDVSGHLAAVVHVAKILLPGDPCVEVSDIQNSDLQKQWAVKELLSNLFSTDDEDSLAKHFNAKGEQVKEIHNALWPGFQIPPLLHSKHMQVRESDAETSQPKVYLKKKTIGTSLAFAWVTWAFSYCKRQPAQRVKSWNFFTKLFCHCLEAAGQLSFRVRRIGEPGAVDTIIEISSHNDTVDSRRLWLPSVASYIRTAWNFLKVDPGSPISSPFERPRMVDLILFGLDPKVKCVVNILRPLALTIVAQFSAWVDAQCSHVALEVENFTTSRQKNRISRIDALNHATWCAIDFYLHENELRLKLEKLATCLYFFSSVKSKCETIHANYYRHIILLNQYLTLFSGKLYEHKTV